MRKRKFAFLIHPRTIEDFGRRVGKILGIGEKLGMKFLPKKFSKWAIKHLRGRSGFTICSHFDVRGEIEGYLIAVLLISKQMKELPRSFVQKRIMDAILFAQNKLRVERIGLGAYTAPMTNSGQTVVSDSRIKCCITHGDSLSATSIIPALKKCLDIKGVEISNATVAVVGAYGLVGRAASILTSELFPKKIILTGHNMNKLKAIEKEIFSYNYTGDILCSDRNTAIIEADITILATTANNTIIDHQMLKENSIVIDMAQPHNMSEEVCDARPDVLRIDGGYMSIPNIDLNFEMGPQKGVSFACFTETLVSTLIGDTRNHVGPVDIKFAKSICKNAAELGFVLAPLTNFSKPILPLLAAENKFEPLFSTAVVRNLKI